MSVKSSISLTDQQDAFARDLVSKGHFPSVSAVLQSGLELLRQKSEAEEVEVEALKTLLRQRKDGAFLAADDFKTRLDQMTDID